MNKYKNYLTIFIPLLLIMTLFLFFSIAKKTSVSNKDKNMLKIVCTTNIIEQTLLNLIPDNQNNINIISLMGPGTDPHLYRATENDVTKLQQADLILYNGLHLESKLSEILEQLSQKKFTVAVSKDIPHSKLFSPPEYKGNFDPHIWFDIKLWKQTIITMQDSLIKLDPNNKNAYTQKTTEYLNQLTNLEYSLKKTISILPTKNRILVTAHDAFNYFGNAFGFTVKGLQGISTQAEPSIKDIQNLAKFIQKNKIKSIFVESSIPKRTIEAVQEATKAQNWSVQIGGELFSDALGSANTPEGTYSGMLKHNIETIVNNLK